MHHDQISDLGELQVHFVFAVCECNVGVGELGGHLHRGDLDFIRFDFMDSDPRLVRHVSFSLSFFFCFGVFLLLLLFFVVSFLFASLFFDLWFLF